MRNISCDVCVVGLGSGGFGAAYAAAMSGASVVGIEKNPMPGGTSVFGGVNSWERGIGGTGVHKTLYDRLKQSGDIIICEYKKWQYDLPVTVYVENSPELEYERTLRRQYGGIITFEPDAMAQEMMKMLDDAGVSGFYNTEYVSCEKDGERIQSIIVRSGDSGEYIKITAKAFVDCTADIYLAADAGCEIDFEPEKPTNSASQMFRITKKGFSAIDPLPDFAKDVLDFVKTRNSPIIFNEYPNGDYNGNLLSIMDGIEYYSLPSEKRLMKARALVYAHWYYLQTVRPELREYKIKTVFPRVGVREGARLVGKYVLTYDDIDSGYLNQNKKDSLIAFADHALDNHASDETHMLKEVDMPYGIPYECLVAKEVSNLLVACRGSSFSKEAASSCRLSRTMIAMGEAAGKASAEAAKKNISVHDIKPETVIPQEVLWPRDLK